MREIGKLNIALVQIKVNLRKLIQEYDLEKSIPDVGDIKDLLGEKNGT